MQLGMIGLGRMGAKMVHRLMQAYGEGFDILHNQGANLL